MTGILSGIQEDIGNAIGWQQTEDFTWTEQYADFPIPEPDVAHIKSTVLEELSRKHIIFPEAEQLVERCVTSLLVGHLILQGPPGTGKTTLAHILADAFGARLEQSTATSEWSPYHVVGGLRPAKSGGTEPQLGVVPKAALACAEALRQSSDEIVGTKMVWLLIDEFNRAEIDRAIGSLYTLLSSCDAEHMKQTPIELWFADIDAGSKLWVPAAFRIIGTMNDLDTNYVSPMSQGLRRRFQFVTVGVPLSVSTDSEVNHALQGAKEWLHRNYGGVQAQDNKVVQEALRTLANVVDGFRTPEETSWPVGTAQIVDVLKVYLVSAGVDSMSALDLAIADRLIAQMNTLTQEQYARFGDILRNNGLKVAARELDHVYKPYVA